ALDSFRSRAGRGVEATVDGNRVFVGRPAFVADGAAGNERFLREHEAAGETVIAVGWAGTTRGLIAVADTLKASSAEAVRELRARSRAPISASRSERVPMSRSKHPT